jgi:hypothetical protein
MMYVSKAETTHACIVVWRPLNDYFIEGIITIGKHYILIVLLVGFKDLDQGIILCYQQ